MVRQVAFAVPGHLDTPTGGYAYDRRIFAELARLGVAVGVVAYLALAFAFHPAVIGVPVVGG